VGGTEGPLRQRQDLRGSQMQSALKAAPKEDSNRRGRLGVPEKNGKKREMMGASVRRANLVLKKKA